MTDARQKPLSASAPHSLFLVVVRRDGHPSRVEMFADMDAMRAAASEWLWNDGVAWVSLNERTTGPRGGRQPPRQTHIMVRRGEDIVVSEQEGRLERVRRATGTRSSPSMPALG